MTLRTPASVLVGGAVSILAGCGSHVCDSIADIDLITVTVIDASTKERICNATVTIRDGAHIETLPSSGKDPATCVYYGGGPGTYAIDASAPGYHSQNIAGVVADGGDHCGGDRQPVRPKPTLELTPGS